MCGCEMHAHVCVNHRLCTVLAVIEFIKILTVKKTRHPTTKTKHLADSVCARQHSIACVRAPLNIVCVCMHTPRNIFPVCICTHIYTDIHAPTAMRHLPRRQHYGYQLQDRRSRDMAWSRLQRATDAFQLNSEQVFSSASSSG